MMTTLVRMRTRTIGALLLGSVACSCSENPGPVSMVPGPSLVTETRVLFIGNSLTLSNHLPGLVDSIAAAVAVPWTHQLEAFGGYSLEDHWVSSRLRSTILNGNWDWVVLQQGPSALPESRDNLVFWTQQFDARIRMGGAKTALYMVWPEAIRRSAFDSVSASYRAAASAAGGTLLPAGDAWLAAWRRDPTLPLYGSDGFHPGIAGSYLAALTIFAGLTGRSPLDVPLRPAGLASVLLELSDDQLRNLRQAAYDVTIHATSGASPNGPDVPALPVLSSPARADPRQRRVH